MRPLSAGTVRAARGGRALPDAMIVIQLAVVWGYSHREREFATDKTADVVSLVAAGRS
jgi:hypothetical protein